jgi:N6-adenosine-specific RNA methylase IME4
MKKTNEKFSTLLADPPLPLMQKGQRGAERHYDLMSVEAIKAMPIADLVTDSAHLWFWCQNASVEASMDIVRAWGFTPRSILTWVKPRIGLGVYLRNATEQLIFATRGKAPVRFRGQPTWAFMPLQDHSHKPEEQFAIIERVSPGPYLELFARRRPPSEKDWSVWGNQIDSDITIPGYPVPSDSAKEAS